MQIAEKIVAEIIQFKPNLPSQETLLLIEFQWNKANLSPWDGGFDLNEETRENVAELLLPYFEKKDTDYLEILRYILTQEIQNCHEGETLTSTLRECYDYLANYKNLEDIPLLLSANDDTSFDANIGLFKDRLFYNGYSTIMAYLKSQNEIDEEIIERIEYYADYFNHK